MKNLIISLFPFLIFSSINAQHYSFGFEDRNREYIVHLPIGYNQAFKYPLVLNFHGYGSNAEEQQAYSLMNEVADKYKFIVVYPNGINKAWNTENGINQGINDIGFTNALLDTIFKKYNVNTAKVYSCGMSMGGYFTYMLGCQLSNRFAALAPVTGVYDIQSIYVLQSFQTFAFVTHAWNK